jgi:WhiB family redox-sensing transcriptional regulator
MSAQPVHLPRRVDPIDWREFANCKGRTELFFGKRAERPEARIRREARAMKLCSECAVIEPCREAGRAGPEYGFWGGENEEQRHRAGFTLTAAIGLRGDPDRKAS